MAIHANSTPVPLSPLFTDPFVRRAFERVEWDDGAAPVIAFRPGPCLSGGSAAAMPGLLRGSRDIHRRATVAHEPVSNRSAPNHPAGGGVVGLLRDDRPRAHNLMQVADRFGSKSGIVPDLPPSVLQALATMGLPPAALLRLRIHIESTIEEMIDVLDLLDAADDDLEPSLAGFYGSDDDREEENEHGTDIDQGEADDSDLELEGAVILGGIGR